FTTSSRFVPSTTLYILFFFDPPPTTHIYTLSLHDALPISLLPRRAPPSGPCPSETRSCRSPPMSLQKRARARRRPGPLDRHQEAACTAWSPRSTPPNVRPGRRKGYARSACRLGTRAPAGRAYD